MCTALNDPLISLKLIFFHEVAEKLNKFLVVFQTEKPMTPFLAETLEVLFRWFMVKFVRKNVLEKASTSGALISIDKKKNQKQISDVDLQFAINQELCLLKQVIKRVNDGMIFQFKKKTVVFLSNICSHLVTESPITLYFT